jgi:uncharacterized protein YbjT (DUF2867 family)
MRICVFGANGPTGRLLTRQALEEDHEVTAFTRHPEAFPIRHPGLRVRAGDAEDADTVEAAIRNQDAVVSTLGVPFSRRPIRVYSEGTTNMVRAMNRLGVERLVVVSSSAVEPNPHPVGGVVFRKVIEPLVVHTMGKTLYADMLRMEAIVTASPLDWTIVRPSGLFTTALVGRYEVTEGHGSGRFTSRADLADCLLREVGAAGHHRRTIAVVTTSEEPGLLGLIWREGIKRNSSGKPAAVDVAGARG